MKTAIRSTHLPLLLLACAFLASNQAAMATVYYVAPGGDDSWDGLSTNKPWATLRHACQQLQAGDVVRVSGGTYDTSNHQDQAVTAHHGTALAPIRIETYNGTPTFDGGGLGFADVCLTIQHTYWNVVGLKFVSYRCGIEVKHPGDNATIQSCLFEDIYDPPGDVSGSGVYIDACSSFNQAGVCLDAGSIDNVHVTSCSFTNIAAEGIYLNCGGIEHGESNEAVFQNNTFTNCGNGIDIKPGQNYDCLVSKNTIIGSPEYGIIYGGVRGIVDRNRIKDSSSTAWGLVLNGSHSICSNNVITDGLNGIVVSAEDGGGDNHRIYNNSLNGMNNGIVFSNIDGSCDNMNVSNNVVVYDPQQDGDATVRAAPPPGSAINASNFFNTNCWGEPEHFELFLGSATHNNPIEQDPGFANADLLITGGPCLNTGVTLWEITHDFLGTERPQGGFLDIGAYEVEFIGRPSGNELATPMKAPIVLETRLHGARPNPFNPATTIAFDLQERGRVELSIVNVQGEMVRKLMDQSLEAGPHEIAWEGRDHRGQFVGSGVYLIRLKTPTGVFLSKAMLLK